MEILERIVGFIQQNISWIFSGIGVSILGFVFRKNIKTVLKNKFYAEKGGMNISIENSDNISNLQTISSGNNSTNLLIKGDYVNGITYQEARDISLDIFRANAQVFTETALQTINNRVDEITNELFNMISTKLPDKLSKLIEPSVQEAILNTQKAYAKNDSKILKNQLIELIYQRFLVEENNIEQIVLDEAITIIPKLSKKHMDILSLQLSTIYVNRGNITNRESFFQMVENEILIFYFEDYTSNNYYAHLQFTGCTTILSEGSSFKPLEEIIYNRFNGLFNKGFTLEEFNNFIGLKDERLNKLITQCLLDNSKYQLNALNVNALEYFLDKYELAQFKDKIIQFFNQTSMTTLEIKENITERLPQFKALCESWSSTSTFKATSLTSVGFAIGILNYNIKTGNELILSQFVK